MDNIKVGFLPFYIKLYDDSNPHLRDPMVAHMETIIHMLRSQGLEIVMPDDLCRIKEEFNRAVDRFIESGVAAVITYHLAYSPSLESIDALLRLDVPIIILDSTPDYALLSAAGESTKFGDNHGIHGVQDLCCMLKRRGRSYSICAGHVHHSNVIDETAGLCRAAAVRQAYQTARIGSVGGSFTGMGDFLISDEQYETEIGAKVIYFTPEDAKHYLSLVTEEEILDEIRLDKQKYTVEAKEGPNYFAATRAGLALRKWIEANRLTACTVNFLTLDICGLPKMPFPECCKIMERGLGYAGEGDVLTAGLVGALMTVYPDVGFTEMFSPDWEQNAIGLSHMGENNPKLGKWKSVLSDKQFNFNSCGDTIGMYSCLRGGKATLVNLAPSEKGFRLVLCPIEMLDVGLEFGAYRYANQGWFRPARSVDTFLKEYSMAGATHHSAIVYDIQIEELKAFGTMMGFDVVVIG